MRRRLVAELKRPSVFEFGAGYVVVAWLVIQAASIALPALDAPAWVLRVFMLELLLGFPVALVLEKATEVISTSLITSVPFSQGAGK